MLSGDNSDTNQTCSVAVWLIESMSEKGRQKAAGYAVFQVAWIRVGTIVCTVANRKRGQAIGGHQLSMRMGRSPGFLFLNTLCAPEQNKTSYSFQLEKQCTSQTALLYFHPAFSFLSFLHFFFFLSLLLGALCYFFIILSLTLILHLFFFQRGIVQVTLSYILILHFLIFVYYTFKTVLFILSNNVFGFHIKSQ